MGTEAHSLHTDRSVGQRFILEGGIKTNDATRGITDYRLHLIYKMNKQVTDLVILMVCLLLEVFILEVSPDSSPINDAGWGRTSPSASNRSTNPYQTTNSPANQSNFTDKVIKFILRPVRVLDNKHIELFSAYLRINIYLQLRQEDTDYLFNDTPNARAASASSTYIKSNNPSHQQTCLILLFICLTVVASMCLLVRGQEYRVANPIHLFLNSISLLRA